MNTIQSLSTEYIIPSRTIETVLLSNGEKEKTCFIYNYEGYSYRFFETQLDLIRFFANPEFEPRIHFENEEDLDLYLTYHAFTI